MISKTALGPYLSSPEWVVRRTWCGSGCRCWCAGAGESPTTSEKDRVAWFFQGKLVIAKSLPKEVIDKPREEPSSGKVKIGSWNVKESG